MSILDWFPNQWTPSKLQAEVLIELEQRWNSSQVFVLRLDVASGKSAVAACIAKWVASKRGRSAGARICTPTNVLVNQYAKLFPELSVTKSPGNYVCETRNTTCGAWSSKQRCRGCVYNKARVEAQDAPISISTYHMSKALYSYRSTMIFDEAHNLGSVVRDMYSPQMFLHQVGAPKDLDALADWALSLNEDDLEELSKKDREILTSYIKDLRSDNPLNFYTLGSAFWSGGGDAWGERLVRSEPTELPVLKMQPIEIFTKPAPFWKDKQKLVLMSATVGRPDLYELGLDKVRPVFIEGDPPITIDRNPIIKDYVGTFSYANQDRMLEPLIKKIYEALEKPGKGVIHMTYGMADAVRPHLEHERLIMHGRGDMRQKLKQFMRSDNGVFIASGLYEGVSLDYDLADWQAISKIVWPSLQDPLQKHRSKEDPDYYIWSTLKNVIQASGRVCRRPDDYGETYIWDASFERLLKEGAHLIPKSFKNRIKKD